MELSLEEKLETKSTKKSNEIRPASSVIKIAPRPKPKQTVLEEDLYVESLEKIIQRDFFPDVPKLRTQSEWLRAEERGDIVKMKEIQENLKGTKETIRETPSSFENSTPSSFTPSNPLTTPNSGLNEKKIELEKKDETLKMSLNQFHLFHTSEDNASFETILEKQREAKRQKYAYLYDKEKEAEQLLLEGSSSRSASLLTWNYTARNLLMYNPEGAVMTVEEEKASNSIPKEINYDNTRVHAMPTNRPERQQEKPTYELIGNEQAALLAKRKAEKDAKINLDEIRGYKSYNTDSPKVGGYGFVMTPTIEPGVEASPFTTWGSIDGTPLLVETSTPMGFGSGPNFKVPETPKREQLAIDLAEKNSKAKKAKIQAAVKNLMSPRGRDIISTPSPHKDMQLRNSYKSPAQRKGNSTPSILATPSPKQLSTPTPINSKVNKTKT